MNMEHVDLTGLKDREVVEAVIAGSEVSDDGDAKDRVAAGVRMLDALVPDWADRIDLFRFDLSSPSCCVLGQVYKAEGEEAAAAWNGDETGTVEEITDGYDWAVYTLFGHFSFPNRYDKMVDGTAALGFCTGPLGEPWGPLEREWRAVIEERQGVTAGA